MAFVSSPWILSGLIRSAWYFESVDGPEYSGLYSVDGGVIRVMHTAALGTRASQAENLGGIETPDVVERLAALKPITTEDTPPTEGFLNPTADQVTAQEIDRWSRRIVYRGWPFLAAYYTEVGATPIGQPPVISGAIEMPNPYRGFESSQFIGHLPYRLLPLGMAGNILTGAAAGVLLPAAFTTLRARRRRSKGLCPTCAYPQSDAACCPECGSPRPAKP